MISSALYVLTWEIIYFGVPGFVDKFVAMCTAQIKNSDASPAAIQTQLDQMKHYNNPLVNVALTFTEPFPIGPTVTLISALILRKEPETHYKKNQATPKQARLTSD